MYWTTLTGGLVTPNVSSIDHVDFDTGVNKKAFPMATKYKRSPCMIPRKTYETLNGSTEQDKMSRPDTPKCATQLSGVYLGDADDNYPFGF